MKKSLRLYDNRFPENQRQRRRPYKKGVYQCVKERERSQSTNEFKIIKTNVSRINIRHYFNRIKIKKKGKRK